MSKNGLHLSRRPLRQPCVHGAARLEEEVHRLEADLVRLEQALADPALYEGREGARRAAELDRVPGLQRDWIHHGSTVWLVAWWRND